MNQQRLLGYIAKDNRRGGLRWVRSVMMGTHQPAASGTLQRSPGLSSGCPPLLLVDLLLFSSRVEGDVVENGGQFQVRDWAGRNNGSVAVSQSNLSVNIYIPAKWHLRSIYMEIEWPGISDCGL